MPAPEAEPPLGVATFEAPLGICAGGCFAIASRIGGLGTEEQDRLAWAGWIRIGSPPERSYGDMIKPQESEESASRYRVRNRRDGVNT